MNWKVMKAFICVVMLTGGAHAGICYSNINGVATINGVLLDYGHHNFLSRVDPDGSTEVKVLTTRPDGMVSEKIIVIAPNAPCSKQENMAAKMAMQQTINSICNSFPDWMKAYSGLNCRK